MEVLVSEKMDAANKMANDVMTRDHVVMALDIIVHLDV